MTDPVEYVFGVETPTVEVGADVFYGGRRWKVESVHDDGDGAFSCHLVPASEIDGYEVVE